MLKDARSEQTLAVLANANQLSAMILKEVVGNELSDSIEGTPLNFEAIYGLTQSKCQSVISAIKLKK